MANVLLLDNAINGIIFEINEYTLLPLLVQAAVLLLQFYFYVATKGKFSDQYFFVIAFLYGSYLGIQGMYAVISNISKKIVRNVYNMITTGKYVEINPNAFIKIKLDIV